jgi:hypothetical protein
MQNLTNAVSRRLQNVGTSPDLIERTVAIIRSLDDGGDPATPFPMEWHGAAEASEMALALRRIFQEERELIPVSVRALGRSHAWQTKASRLLALKSRMDRMFWGRLRERYEETLLSQIYVCENDFKSLHHELDEGLCRAVSPRINTVLGYGSDDGLTGVLSTNVFCLLRYLAGFAMVRDIDRFEEVAALARHLPGPLPLGTAKDKAAWFLIVR